MQAREAFGSGYGEIIPPQGASGRSWRLDHATHGVLGPRFVAWVIDAAFAGAITLVVGTVFGALTLASFGLLHPLFALLALVPFVYTWLSVGARFGATPGMALVGLGVRDVDTLAPPGMSRAFVWTLGYALTMLAGVVWLAVALITRRHRALHDLVAGVAVARIAPLGEAGGRTRAFEAA